MNLYDLSRRMCEWDELSQWRQRFRRTLHSDHEGELYSPFLLLGLPGISADEQHVSAERWMGARLSATSFVRAERKFRDHSAPSQRIRIGYLSNDFHDHATAFLMIELFEHHDREQFELFAYSYGKDDGKAMRVRLESSFEHFVDVQALTISETAETIHQDDIDILIDLKGFTRGTRTEVLAHRPAPVQVNFLGYPGTLGPDLCDYIITDHFLTPHNTQADYSERFAYLPDSYQPRGCHAPIAVAPSRASVGLPETGFVFCCFNQSSKITPDIFAIWCRLLSHNPDSVLWLLADRMAEGNLKNLAMQQGVLPSRLVFAEHVAQEDHLARLQLADLLLDTLPYNAHTTASDALWAGVPLVTCSGDTFASRVAGSLLHAVGLPELITDDLESYFELALALSKDSARYESLVARLWANRLTTPLFDIKRYTLHLEDLYRQMWGRFQSGEAPTALDSTLDR